MQSTDQNDERSKIESRLRAIRAIWFAMFMSIGLYYMLTIFTGNPHEDSNRNGRLFLALTGLAALCALISLPIKQKFLTRAVDEQDIKLVQTGYVVAWALSEVAALLGLFDYFLTGNRHYYYLFVIAACGLLMNFPRRQHLLDASFKNSAL